MEMRKRRLESECLGVCLNTRSENVFVYEE